MEATRKHIYGFWSLEGAELKISLSIQRNGSARLKINGDLYPILGWDMHMGHYRIGEYLAEEVSETSLLLSKRDTEAGITRYLLTRKA